MTRPPSASASRWRPLDATSASHPRATPPGRPLRVVIVEDEWLIVQDLEAALLDIGHLPAGSAGDVPAALALLAGLEADAALIDVELRGQTSEPIVAQCRRRGLPVIIASAHTPGQLPDFCDGLPYLGKPVHYGRLAEMLAAVS